MASAEVGSVGQDPVGAGDDVEGELVRDIDVLGPKGSGPSAAGMPRIDGAVCSLLQIVEEAGGFDPVLNPGGNQILLDTTVGDVRCLLIRNGGEEFGVRRRRLSPHEEEIARMVARGFTNKTIAHDLEISLWTVSTHLRRVFAKLGVTTRAAMVARLLTDDIPPICRARSHRRVGRRITVSED